MRAVFLAGATALVTALGVRLARSNWPLAGFWDPSHGLALAASLRVGCCAFPYPDEPLANCRYVLLGLPRPAWLVERVGVTVITTWREGEAWLEPARVVTDPGEDLSQQTFRWSLPVDELAQAMALTCSSNYV